MLSDNPENKASLAARRAAIARASRAGDEHSTTEARREYAAARLVEFISKTVASAPPLTDEQRKRITALLVPPGGGRVA